MHRAGDQLLADAALAQDEDRDARAGRPLAQPLDHGHGGRGADQLLEGDLAGRLLLEAIDLALQVAHLQRVADRDHDPLRRGRLDEEVLRAGLHGLDHGVDAAGGGQHDDGLHEAARAHLLQRLQAALARHDKVQHDHVSAARAQAIDRLFAVFSMDDNQAFALEHRLDQAPLGRIVIDDENRLGHGPTNHHSMPPLKRGRCLCPGSSAMRVKGALKGGSRSVNRRASPRFVRASPAPA